MQVVRIKESYWMERNGVRAVFDVLVKDAGQELFVQNFRGFKEMDHRNRSLPDHMGHGEKRYTEDSIGFLREDGSIFVLVQGEDPTGLEPWTLKQVMDLGLEHYSESWSNHSIAKAA